MLKKITIVDSTDRELDETFETDNILQFIMHRFSSWPKNTRLYRDAIIKENDITPVCKTDFDRILKLDGDFYVVTYPGDPLTLGIIAVGALLVGGFLLYKATEQIPEINFTDDGAPNNSLSNRTNKVRIHGRIPDSFGTFKAIPDQLMIPHIVYEDHIEVEISYLCVGKGTHGIFLDGVRDGTTILDDVSGTSASFYDPDESPNSGDSPFLEIGDSITEAVRTTYRIDGINNQKLRAPNENTYTSSNSIRCIAPNIIERNAGDVFTDAFTGGDIIDLTNADWVSLRTTGAIAVDLAGQGYTVTSVSATQIVLTTPNLINGDWALAFVDTFFGSDSSGGGPDIQIRSDKWTESFFVDNPDTKHFIFNFLCPNGLYKANDNKQTAQTLDIDVGITPVDVSGTPTGAEVVTPTAVVGSAKVKTQRAITLKHTVTTKGRFKVRFKRNTDTDLDFNGQVIDDLIITESYFQTDEEPNDFGDVTTVHTKTLATIETSSIKSRKFSCISTRKIPFRVAGSTFSAALVATSRADEILSFICLDPHIGNRTSSEIDFDSIYDTMAAIDTYFGNSIASNFNYTFDRNNMSFEETVQAIMSAVFCIAYRSGNVLKIAFEQSTEDSILLFNHRNKLPQSEVRSIGFGETGDNDGLEYEYVDSTGDSYKTEIVSLPVGVELFNPKKVKSLGVIDSLKAFYNAYRIYNKILYQNVRTTFEATQESDILIRNDRILVADNTRDNTQDGEVVSIASLVLTLSQKITFEMSVNYSIFLQHTDGTVETIPITAGATDYEVTLGFAPSQTLALSDGNFAKATYLIVGDDSKRELPFLLVRSRPKSNLTSDIEAINYDQRYYENDFLILHITFNIAYTDESPLQNSLVAESTSAIETNATRGQVHRGLTNLDEITLTDFLTTASYTKMMWIEKDDHVTPCQLMSNGDEDFEVTSGGLLRAGHASSGAVSYNLDNDDLTIWHHVAVTYDATSLDMKLYADGVLVDTNLSVAQRTIGDTDLIACGGSGVGDGYIGDADSIRIYNKALSDAEILDMYNKTRLI